MSTLKTNRIENLTTTDGGISINNSGNVGIGTSSALTPLDVVKSGDNVVSRFSNGTRGLEIAATSTGGSLQTYNATQTIDIKTFGATGSDIKFSTNNTERMRIDSNGYVDFQTGILGDNPSDNFTLNGRTQPHYGFNLVPETGVPIGISGYRGIAFATNGAEAMRIDSSGRLLLGTTTEGEANADDLTIATSGHTGMTIRSGTANRGNIYFSDGTSGDAEYRGIIEYNHDGDTLKLGTANNVRATIDSSGNVGIGTTSPSQILELKSAEPRLCLNGTTADAARGIEFEINGTRQAALFHNAQTGETCLSSGDNGSGYFIKFNTDQSERLRIASNGNTSIKNASFFHPGTNNAIALGTSSLRWTAVYAVNGTIQTSDKRLKTEIANSSLATDFIKSLRPVSYKWIEGGKRDSGERDEDNNNVYESVPGKRTHWGFIAQEVKEAADDAGVDFGGWVLSDKDDADSEQALRYDQFIAPLTKALQEAIAKIETLEVEVAALKSN